LKTVFVYISTNANEARMTKQDVNKERDERGVFAAGNDVAGWFALSRDGVNIITYYEGKYTFSAKNDVTKRYTETGFAIRITQLQNRGY